MNKLVFNLVLTLLPVILKRKRITKIPVRDSILTGALYYQEIMSTPSLSRFRELARMDKPTFQALLTRLLATNKLKHSRNICAGQKLMMFLYSLTGKGNRDIQERWQHSGETVSRIIHEVSESILFIQADYINLAPNPTVSASIQNNRKFYPYFRDCIGALDGTHIPAIVAIDIDKPFRNRKGFISQNVLAVCNFDMTFSYVLAGWKGSALDGRVLTDSVTKGFPLRAGKFYLGDAGYGLTYRLSFPPIFVLFDKHVSFRVVPGSGGR
jgi:hypothetical protein